MDKEELFEKKSLDKKDNIFEKEKLVIKKELGIKPSLESNNQSNKEQEMINKNIKISNMNYNKYSNK